MVDLAEWAELLEERPVVAVKRKLKKRRPVVEVPAAPADVPGKRRLKKRKRQVVDTDGLPSEEPPAKRKLKKRKLKRAAPADAVANASPIVEQAGSAAPAAVADASKKPVAEMPEGLSELEQKEWRRKAKKMRREHELTDKMLAEKQTKREENEQLNARKIFVGGMNMADDVKKLFGKCGEFNDFSFPKDKDGREMGIAFITFKTNQGFEAALKMDATEWGGRRINVKIAEHNKGDKGKGKGKDKGKGKGKDKGKGKGKFSKGKGKGKGKDDFGGGKGKSKGGKGKSKGGFKGGGDSKGKGKGGKGGFKGRVLG